MQLLISFLVSIVGVVILLLQDRFSYAPFTSYLYSIPIMTVCVAKIIQIKKDNRIEEWGGLLCMVPAFGYTASKYAIALHDMKYLAVQQGVAHLLRIFFVATEGVFPLFFVCSLCAWMVGCRLVSTMFVIVSISQGFVRLFLYKTVVELDHGSAVVANSNLIIAESVRFLMLVFLIGYYIYRIKKQQFYAHGPFAFALVIGAFFVIPPISYQLSKLEVARPLLKNPPVGTPMYGAAVVSANPKSTDFSRQLDAQGSTRYRKMAWWCDVNPRIDWQVKTRATATISMMADDRFGVLNQHIEEFFYRGITRLSFVAESQENHWGPLAKHTKYPVARFLLDPVPHQAFFGIADNEQGVRWLKEEPRELIEEEITPCGIWVGDNITIQTLISISQKYGESQGICSYGLFLLFGTPETGKEFQWKSPLSCQK